jgi:hypothetical protein
VLARSGGGDVGVDADPADGTLSRVTDERWTTTEEITAARERMETAIDGYERPAAYALGLTAPGEASPGAVFPRVNRSENFLPAVVLATVCGHVRGTATYVLDQQRLQEAIDLLAPAEACTAYDHPNLAVWRQVRTEAANRPGRQVVAVFLGDLQPSSTEGRYERLLRSAVAS